MAAPDPFDALLTESSSWHYGEPSKAVTPEAVAVARMVYDHLQRHVPDVRISSAVGGGIFIEATHDHRDVILVVLPDGSDVMLAGTDHTRTYPITDLERLIADTVMELTNSPMR